MISDLSWRQITIAAGTGTTTKLPKFHRVNKAYQATAGFPGFSTQSPSSGGSLGQAWPHGLAA